MPINVGETLPNVTVYIMGKNGPQPVSVESLFAGRTILLFALPGAFTPTCSKNHLPGFVDTDKRLKEHGIDDVLCLSVNDAWVMDAWQKDQRAGSVTMIADGNADFTEAVDMLNDRTSGGMGLRSKRYAMVVNDLVVEWVAIDKAGLSSSSADSVLDYLSSQR